MGARNFQFLLDGLHEITGFRETAHEVTLEANPESFSESFARAALNAGCNRVSLGVQSFQPDVLAAFDRLHSAEEAKNAFAIARSVGFSRINLDFIYAFPGQDPRKWESDLAEAIKLDPEHLSCYELAYEPGTALTRLRDSGRWTEEGPEACKQLFLSTREKLAEAGYLHYEVSNYAKRGEKCLHNLASWRSLDYVGLGAGAASWRNGCRSKNLHDPKEYQRAIDGFSELEMRGPEEALFDHMLMGLRLPGEGVSRARAIRQTGIDPVEHWRELFQGYSEKGWLNITSTSVCVTTRGLLLLDTILGQMLPEV